MSKEELQVVRGFLALGRLHDAIQQISSREMSILFFVLVLFSYSFVFKG